jgi:hypothetical protein
LAGIDNLAILFLQAQQDFVMPSLTERSYRLNRLPIQEKTVVTHGFLDAADPANLFLAPQQVTVFHV